MWSAKQRRGGGTLVRSRLAFRCEGASLSKASQPWRVSEDVARVDLSSREGGWLSHELDGIDVRTVRLLAFALNLLGDFRFDAGKCDR